MNIRMMFPFTMVCDSCHEYNYTGTKFTARVEHIKAESYLDRPEAHGTVASARAWGDPRPATVPW